MYQSSIGNTGYVTTATKTHFSIPHHRPCCCTAASDATELNTIIEATIGMDTFPWPGPDGCSLLENDSCPLQSGRKYKYSAFMPVLEEYPAVSDSGCANLTLSSSFFSNLKQCKPWSFIEIIIDLNAK